jgi:hypothetical protein
MESTGSVKIQLESAILCLDLSCNTVFDGSLARHCPVCAGKDTYPLGVWLNRSESLTLTGRLSVPQSPAAIAARVRAA